MLLSNLQYVVKNEYLEGDAIMKTYSHGGISCPSMSEKIFLSLIFFFLLFSCEDIQIGLSLRNQLSSDIESANFLS